MLQITTATFIEHLQSFPPEFTTALSLLTCYLAIILVTKFLHIEGLYVYSVVAIIAANMQALKAMEVTWYNKPIALGTVVYATTFLTSDVITELYGAVAARKSILLGFAGSIIIMLLMNLSLAFKPLNVSLASEHTHFNQAHDALRIIFSPNAAIVTASMAAYILSQLADIFVFSKLKKHTHNSYLWLRTFCSVSIAAFVDTIVFSVLAWVIFAPEPISWNVLIFSYILGAYLLQMLVGLLNIPTFYLLLKIVRKA